MFVAFEGIDGAGKSSVSNVLYEMLTEAGIPCLYVRKKSVSARDEYLQSHIERVRTLIWGYPHESPIENLGDGHWLHLMASWFYLVEVLEIEPAIAKGELVIIEGWTAKFIARYAMKSQERHTQAADAMRDLRRPDVTFFLNVKPEIAARRKGQFTPSECGALDNPVSVSADSFVTYQTGIAEILKGFSDDDGWTEVGIDNEPPEQLAEHCFEIVLRRKHDLQSQ